MVFVSQKLKHIIHYSEDNGHIKFGYTNYLSIYLIEYAHLK
jgi:hypothetical protein